MQRKNGTGYQNNGDDYQRGGERQFQGVKKYFNASNASGNWKQKNQGDNKEESSHRQYNELKNKYALSIVFLLVQNIRQSDLRKYFEANKENQQRYMAIKGFRDQLIKFRPKAANWIDKGFYYGFAFSPDSASHDKDRTHAYYITLGSDLMTKTTQVASCETDIDNYMATLAKIFKSDVLWSDPDMSLFDVGDRSSEQVIAKVVAAEADPIIEVVPTPVIAKEKSCVNPNNILARLSQLDGEITLIDNQILGLQGNISDIHQGYQTVAQEQIDFNNLQTQIQGITVSGGQNVSQVNTLITSAITPLATSAAVIALTTSTADSFVALSLQTAAVDASIQQAAATANEALAISTAAQIAALTVATNAKMAALTVSTAASLAAGGSVQFGVDIYQNLIQQFIGSWQTLERKLNSLTDGPLYSFQVAMGGPSNTGDGYLVGANGPAQYIPFHYMLGYYSNVYGYTQNDLLSCICNNYQFQMSNYQSVMSLGSCTDPTVGVMPTGNIVISPGFITSSIINSWNTPSIAFPGATVPFNQNPNQFIIDPAYSNQALSDQIFFYVTGSVTCPQAISVGFVVPKQLLFSTQPITNNNTGITIMFQNDCASQNYTTCSTPFSDFCTPMVPLTSNGVNGVIYLAIQQTGNYNNTVFIQPGSKITFQVHFKRIDRMDMVNFPASVTQYNNRYGTTATV